MKVTETHVQISKNSAVRLYSIGRDHTMHSFLSGKVVIGDQEQRVAPQQSEVGVAPEVTWNVGGRVRSRDEKVC